MATTYRTTRHVRPRPWTELVLLGVLYVGYSAARLLADDDRRRAVANARHVLGIEHWLHLDVEAGLNHLVAGAPAVALLASYWYAALHYLVTPAVLVWVYRRHPLGYRRVRNALVVATATGLAGFVLLPVAPPRMLAGYADVLASTSAHGWWGADASAPKGLGGLTNEMAAMPSLHVGWALWCAWVVFLCSRSPWLRTLATTYALGTVVVVLGTGNHYLLDAVGGAAVLALGVRVTRPVGRLGPPWEPSPRPRSPRGGSRHSAGSRERSTGLDPLTVGPAGPNFTETAFDIVEQDACRAFGDEVLVRPCREVESTAPGVLRAPGRTPAWNPTHIPSAGSPRPWAPASSSSSERARSRRP